MKAGIEPILGRYLNCKIAGTDYRLAKRFSGASGTATLTQTGGSTWQAEEAEEKLSALLGVEIISGRGAGEKVEQ